MTSTFTFIRIKWRTIDPAWPFCISVYLIARIALSAWAFAISALIPLSVANLNLHGEPVVTAFDLHTSTRAVFSRVLDKRELHFQPASRNLVDAETSTVWDLTGRAVSGALRGTALGVAVYSIEEIFPYRGVAPSQNTFLAIWQRFDANWYLKIAQGGYGDEGSTVYFPLYPLLIRALGTLFLGRDLLAAMIISNLALVGALYVLYQISKDLIGVRDSKRAIAFLLLFPTAFFLFAPYTESLFLFFALASIREGTRARWGRSGIFGALAALTRLQGVLMIVPLAYLAWKDFRKQKSSIAGRESQIAPFRFYFLRFAPLLLIPLSTLAFLAFTNLSLFTAYSSQLHARFVFPWDNLAAAIAMIVNSRASLIDVLNLFFTFLFGIMVAVTWFILPREFGLYSLVMYLAPLFRMTTEQPLVSVARYALAIFPVFILWGKWGRNAWIARSIAYLSLPLQLYLSAQFVLWGWVG